MEGAGITLYINKKEKLIVNAHLEDLCAVEGMKRDSLSRFPTQPLCSAVIRRSRELEAERFRFLLIEAIRVLYYRQTVEEVAIILRFLASRLLL